MAWPGAAFFRRVFLTPYAPDPTLRTFLGRAQTQQGPAAEVTVVVPDSRESARLFGVPLARRVPPVDDPQEHRLQPAPRQRHAEQPGALAGVGHGHGHLGRRPLLRLGSRQEGPQRRLRRVRR